MTDDEILLLPIGDLLAVAGVLFLWATSPRLDFALRCLEKWGLHYRGMSFVWVKCTKAGVPIGAQGVPPSITKPTSELVLASSRVARGRPMPLADLKVPQVLLAPRGAHSSKPPEVMRRIERLYPGAHRLEMFARQRRPGWDAWGDEVPSETEDVPSRHLRGTAP
jgi:N6-adenosine-specific RNA methylase IME4